MAWSFISGLLAAFFGAFIAHLFVTYRNQKEQYQELIAALAQIAELDREQFREAGNAAVEARKREVNPKEVAHKGNRLWNLRKRVHEAAEPIYTKLPGECKDSIDTMDEWIMKLRNGPGPYHMNHRWVTGEAGNAIKSIPSYNFPSFLYHYFAWHRPSYPDTMELKDQEQAEIKAALEHRQQGLEEIGSHDEEVYEEE